MDPICYAPVRIFGISVDGDLHIWLVDGAFIACFGLLQSDDECSKLCSLRRRVFVGWYLTEISLLLAVLPNDDASCSSDGVGVAVAATAAVGVHHHFVDYVGGS